RCRPAGRVHAGLGAAVARVSRLSIGASRARGARRLDRRDAGRRGRRARRRRRAGNLGTCGRKARRSEGVRRGGVGMSHPRFAIVGHPNKGKSSIVATLAEDDSVEISPQPGTTTRARSYPMRLDGEILYELIDTPGVQRAREVLEWLESHDRGAGRRAEVVRDFLREHADDRRFHDERELLTPIMDGAGILYVVDGSRPYGRQYEAEMEILRWTGRPRMALINMIGAGDHVDE